MAINAILPAQVLADGANDGDVLTVQADGSVAFETPAGGGGIGGSTGSTDNAILRADGTGGSTLQAASWIMPDNYTASPNATVNVCALEATGATTNVAVAIVPKGTGAVMFSVPDGTAAGGDARGANAIDLQAYRTAASQVASAIQSTVVGNSNRASGSYSAAVGSGCQATGLFATAVGSDATAAQYGAALGYDVDAGNMAVVVGAQSSASGYASVALGNGCVASQWGAVATGFVAKADRVGMRAHSHDRFAASGDSQRVDFGLYAKTTDATPQTMLLGKTYNTTAQLTIASGKILHATVQVIGSKSDGSAIAIYQRQVAIANVGGTTALVGSVNTIGSDTAASTSLSITADNTNDSLKIEVTGIAAETWRWFAGVSGVEMAYGS
jgi:hypothetical protein